LGRRRLFTTRLLKWLPEIALMIDLAIGQAVFFNLSVYAQVPEYRTTYVLVCRYPRCEVPEYENYDEQRASELVIRGHPDESEASLDRCPFTQQWAL
jgi:hypothetical protein